MSGTSLDGIDAVLTEIDTKGKARLIQSHSVRFDAHLRSELAELQFTTNNELHREHLAIVVCQHLLDRVDPLPGVVQPAEDDASQRQRRSAGHSAKEAPQ